MELRKSDNILDVACGPGHITNKLSKITNGKVTGIDISEGMIKQAKTFIRARISAYCRRRYRL